MQVTITDVKKDMVTVSGQPTHRHYAETVLLPMLMANAGRNNAAKFETIKVFHEAGLSLKAIPDDASIYFLTLQDNERIRKEKLKLSQEAAERCREDTPKEIAEAKRFREERAAAIREQSRRVRASSSRNNGY
jgi:hypothetical protein